MADQQDDTRKNVISRTRSSKPHSLKVTLRKPHSIVNTSESIAAEVGFSWTPEKSTVRGDVLEAFYPMIRRVEGNGR